MTPASVASAADVARSRAFPAAPRGVRLVACALDDEHREPRHVLTVEVELADDAPVGLTVAAELARGGPEHERALAALRALL